MPLTTRTLFRRKMLDGEGDLRGIGISASIMSGWRPPHIQVCMPLMLVPITRRSRRSPAGHHLDWEARLTDEQRKTEQQIEREWMTTAALRDAHRKAADTARLLGQVKEEQAAWERWRETNVRCREIEAEFRVLTRAVFPMEAKP